MGIYKYTSNDDFTISLGEQNEIVQWIKQNYTKLNNNGFNRFMKSMDEIDNIPPIVWEIKKRIVEKEQLENANVKFYDNVWDVVINKGNVNFLDTAYAADVVLHTVPEIKGKDSAKAYYANYVTGFSNRQFIVKEIFGKGNKVVKYWQFKGTHTGPFFGIPATGKTVDVIGCTIATVVDLSLIHI